MRNRVEEFALAARKAREEDSAARAILQEIDEQRWSSLTFPLPEAWMTLGMAHELVRVAHDLLVRAPHDSAHVAELATMIVGRLDPQDYPRVNLAQVEAAAWKDESSAGG